MTATSTVPSSSRHALAGPATAVDTAGMSRATALRGSRPARLRLHGLLGFLAGLDFLVDVEPHQADGDNEDNAKDDDDARLLLGPVLALGELSHLARHECSHCDAESRQRLCLTLAGPVSRIVEVEKHTRKLVFRYLFRDLVKGVGGRHVELGSCERRVTRRIAWNTAN